jgi:hypothetical protein
MPEDVQLMGRPRDGRSVEATSENTRWQGDSGTANHLQAHSEVAAYLVSETEGLLFAAPETR